MCRAYRAVWSLHGPRGNDLLGKLADLSEDAMKRLWDSRRRPPARRDERDARPVDELQRASRARSLEQRLAELERKVDELSKSDSASSTPRSRKTTTTKSSGGSRPKPSSRTPPARSVGVCQPASRSRTTEAGARAAPRKVKTRQRCRDGDPIKHRAQRVAARERLVERDDVQLPAMERRPRQQSLCRATRPRRRRAARAASRRESADDGRRGRSGTTPAR